MSKDHLKEFKLTNRKMFPNYPEQLRQEIIKQQEEALKAA
jgi:hypothetical protein